MLARCKFCFNDDAQTCLRKIWHLSYIAAQINEEDLIAGETDYQRRLFDVGVRPVTYTGTGKGATSRNSTLNSCSSLGTVQNVALLLPGTFSPFTFCSESPSATAAAAVAMNGDRGPRKGA